jgi:hypothetical protein
LSDQSVLVSDRTVTLSDVIKCTLESRTRVSYVNCFNVKKRGQQENLVVKWKMVVKLLLLASNVIKSVLVKLIIFVCCTCNQGITSKIYHINVKDFKQILGSQVVKALDLHGLAPGSNLRNGYENLLSKKT